MENEQTAFDNDAFKRSLGLYSKQTEPYNYEYHHAMNPNLTIEVYDYCYKRGMAWKIRCGKEIWKGYREVILEAAWWLDTEQNNRERYMYGRD